MAKIDNQIQHLQKNKETFYLGHCLENDYVFKFEVIDGIYHVHAKDLNGNEFEVSPYNDDVLDVKFDGTVISKEEYETYGIQDFAEVGLTYHPCTMIPGNPNIHITITKNLTTGKVTECRVFAGRKCIDNIRVPKSITDAINRQNIEGLQFKSIARDIHQLDGGHFDYSFRLSCKDLDCKFGEHNVEESVLDHCDDSSQNSILLSLLCHWATKISEQNNTFSAILTKDSKKPNS